MDDAIIKNHIKNILTRYNEHKPFSYGLDKAIGELSLFVMFNKMKKDRKYISFATDIKRPLKFSNKISELLDDDLLEYIKELTNDKTINKNEYDLNFIIRLVLGNFYMFSMTSSFGEVLDADKYEVLKTYIHNRYRIKFRYYVLYNIIVKDIIPNIDIDEYDGVLDFTPTEMFSGLADELSKDLLLEHRKAEVYLRVLKLYMDNKIHIQSIHCSEIKQGVVKQFLQTNLIAK